MTTENRRILIIDDERPILLTLTALLERRGYQVESAPTASQGLKLLKTKSPPLVLLDLQLPDAEGLQTLDQIKANASRDAGHHFDRARHVEQRDRVDQARRLSFHQQAVRAGRIA